MFTAIREAGRIPRPFHIRAASIRRGGGVSLRRRHRRRAFLEVAFALFVANSAFATPLHAQPTTPLQSPSLQQLDHTAWTIRDGAPADVTGIVQTADGYLWLGSTSGIYRFDGVHFERFASSGTHQLPSTNISTLLALPDGDLWIGYRFGGASRLHVGELTDFGTREGLPTSSVNEFARDSSGTLFAATTTGVYALHAGQWRHVGAAVGLPDGLAGSIVTDRRGAVWISTPAGVFVRPPGVDRFEWNAPTLGDVNAGSIREAPDGSVWGVSVERGLVPLSQTKTMEPSIRVRQAQSASVIRWLTGARTLLVDSDGHAWMSGNGRLFWLKTVARGGVVAADERQTMTHADGLSGNTVITFAEDREGSIWVGTEGGLDRFRSTKLTAAPVPPPLLGPAIAPGNDGALWVASTSGASYRVTDRAQLDRSAPSHVECIYRDLDNGLWMATMVGVPGAPASLWHSTGGPFQRVALAPGVSDGDTQALAVDRNNRLWMSIVRRGVSYRESDGWSEFGASLGLSHTPAIVIVTDSLQRVWLGYSSNTLAQVQRTSAGHDSLRLYSERDGLTIGNVLAVHVSGGRVWVGGERGLQLLVGERFVPIRATTPDALVGLSGIVSTPEGELWVNGSNGISRLPASELRAASEDSTYRVQLEHFDYRDGIEGAAPQIRPLPSAIRGSDGRLWFSTSNRVLWIDPLHVRRNPLPPPVQIRGVASGGHVFEPGDAITLPMRTTALEVRYTALSLRIPERVRFRYQLVGGGLDTAWQDAGGRREAFYTNLRPGAYHFRVLAANEDGVWSPSAASIDVVIPPAFVQTDAFLVLCALASAATIWLLLQWRHRRATTAIRARFEATLRERTRIARELHDTLLQGFVGVTTQLYAVQRLLDDRPTVAADVLSRTINIADHALRDARHAVWELRAPELESTDLPTALAAAANETFASSPTRCHLTVRGDHRPLPDSIELAAFRIGREAVANAAKHAAAQLVEIEVVYEPDQLQIVVRDDGRGFTATVPDDARRDGHWGVVGMRERATAAGGTLRVDAVPGRGTCVTLVLPCPASSRSR